MRTVRVVVPATTANLGPGFDSLAMALGLHNTFELSDTDSGLAFHITGEGADDLPRDASNMVVKGAQAVFKASGRAPGGLSVRIHSEIPLSSGLGSSASALLGGTVAANALVDYPLKREEVLHIATKLEGHPDNVTAALLGGLVISSYDDEGMVYRSVPVQPLQVIVVLPDVKLSTGAAREALPESVPLKDAAHNAARTALVVQALVMGDFKLLGEAMHDRLHEPYRKKLIPGFEEVGKAARASGAAAIALSGAGPALVAFAGDPDTYEGIAGAMAGAFEKATGSPARWWILPVDTQGIAISEMMTEVPATRPRVRPLEPEPPPASGDEPPTDSETADKAAKPLGLGEAAELLRSTSDADGETSGEPGSVKPDDAPAASSSS